MTERQLLGALQNLLAGSPATEALGIFTDEVTWRTLDDLVAYLDEDRLAHLLEVRAYDATRELHAIRTQMGTKFRTRRIESEPPDGTAPADTDEGFCTDEWQLLDIDESAPGVAGTHYRATAGGAYDLPVPNARRVHVRNYYRYDDEGMAQYLDFRIVGLDCEVSAHG